jgi:hypothetical protein
MREKGLGRNKYILLMIAALMALIFSASSASANDDIDITLTTQTGVKLAFTTPAQTITAGSPSAIITIQVQDASSGNPLNVAADTTINLTSSSAQGKFSLNASPWSDITSVIIPNGSNSASFYYKDTAAGNPTITAAEFPDQGWTDATQQQTVTSGGGGGGGGGAAEEEGCPAGQVSIADKITPEGVVIEPIVLKSSDGRLELTIEAGTVAVTSAGSGLCCVGIQPREDMPSPPEGAYVIGVMYDVVPDGATFLPPATIKYHYDPTAIPEGVAEESLVLAYYDEASSKWIKLDSIVDAETNMIIAETSHLTFFAVFGYEVGAPPPATFQISSLGISPTKVEIGNVVNLTILVTNTGGQSASYQVILKINGVAEATKEVILDAGASEQVSFTTSKEVAGTYSVDINNATGAFEVEQKPALPPAKPINWGLIGGIIGGVVAAAGLIFLFLVRRGSA